MILQPVLVPVPCDVPLRTPQQVERQRVCARLALRYCAGCCGAPEEGWEKDTDEVPLPQQGWYWSVSHKRHWAAAVVADQPVGIDIEHVIPRREAMFDEIACAAEWGLLGGRSWRSFFRLWTAKEAILKATGIGIAGLNTCRLEDIPDARHLTLEYENREWVVEHFYHADHVAAVTSGDAQVSWHVLDPAANADASDAV
ncbi:MAG: 4'-phosphopantetheinyl transferase superfamily protein [Phycisphaerales bacterium]|nr:MAG: 4'-phosphopantetheinyl transferase superfamily protein [Phycisphaerales bacterium]